MRTAYDLAERLGDTHNLSLIAHSLATLFLDDVKNVQEGAAWLEVWRSHVGVETDDYDDQELIRLARVVSDHA
ncbi:MAG: hypothetical protein R2712_26480 [Vicinamibacterales bacterium]